MWGVGLRLKEQKGSRRVPHPWSQRVGDLSWEPNRLPGFEWVGRLPFGSGKAPPACLSLSPWPPSCAPKDPHSLEGALEGRGPAWELSRLPGPQWAGQSPSAPLPVLPDDSSHLPLLIFPALGALILSGLQFSSPLSPPTSYQFTLGFLPSPWASESPTSSWQVP